MRILQDRAGDGVVMMDEGNGGTEKHVGPTEESTSQETVACRGWKPGHWLPSYLISPCLSHPICKQGMLCWSLSHV